MAPRKVIIDTDPGVDDVLAMLLAFSASPEELEILLISVTYGNTDVQNALRNVVALFSIIEKDMEWRKTQSGRRVGFETLQKSKPLVAIGPDHPLADQLLMADYFHGRDGLAGIHETHPHLSPAETWKKLFISAEQSDDPSQTAIVEEMKKTDALFTPSREPGAQAILRLLRENEPDTITMVAVGPLTNLALAAAEDPETFLRAKEVVVMGGNVDEPGNITPVAEFNTFADTIAAARIYALTSPRPSTTMPPTPPPPPGTMAGSSAPPPFLSPYPPTLSRRMKVTLFPLDVTDSHRLLRGKFDSTLKPLLEAKSPLAEWVSAFMASTFTKVESLSSSEEERGDAVGLSLHDPMCVWYCIAGPSSLPSFSSTSGGDGTGNVAEAEAEGKWKFVRQEDMRVETAGQWTRGMCVVDRRPRRERDDDGEGGEVAGDHGDWLHARSGNRIDRCIATPVQQTFGDVLLERIFAL